MIRTLTKTLFIIVWTVLVTFVLGSIVILVSFFDSKGNMSHKIARLWARSILAVSSIKVTVKGLSNIDPAASYIYMSNHQSNYDIPVLLGYLPIQFRWLAKAELFKIPIFGRGMRGAGYISIDRSNRRAAFKSLKEAAKIIKSGVSVLIFPEGTRSRDGNIRPFKKGGFVLAVDSGVPIVPVIIHGTRAIMPKGRILIKPGNVILEIQKPISTLNYARKTKEDLMEKVRNTICDFFEKGEKDMSRC